MLPLRTPLFVAIVLAAWLTSVPAGVCADAPPVTVPAAAEDAGAQDPKPAAQPPAKPEEKKTEEKKPEEKAGEKKEEEKKPLLKTPVQPPRGAAGPSRVRRRDKQEDDHFVPMPDRWRIGFPDWDRYPGGLGAPYKRGRWWDPYNQNVLKGDYPIWGQRTFMDLSLSSETVGNTRRLPTPSNVSADDPGAYTFFGRGEQRIIDETLQLSMELFRGDTAFKPKEWAFKFTPSFNLNHQRALETGVVNIDVTKEISRADFDSGIQELFGEYKIADLSRNYDFLSVRTGVQPFSSDFRGFLYADSQPGLRLFGNAKSNRWQYNLAYFRQLQKDTYSRLNRVFEDRGQDVVIANIYRQDLFRPGYTGQFTLAYNGDHSANHFDNNDRPTIPPLLGDNRPHSLRVGYAGFNGEGHLGRLNVTHAFYQAFGRDTHNPIAGRPTTIDAQLAAAEVSYDRDWWRVRSSFLYASGDSRPRDGRARGFDAIVDNPIFAGGPFSFWQSQGIPLLGSGVALVTDGSFLPSLRSSRIEGQSNFVNPGLMLVNVGADAELTPKWRVSGNINFLSFQKTQPLELVLNQSGINRGIGVDFSIGVRHRPFLNENVVLTLGASAFVPGQGFKDIYQRETLYSFFTKMGLTY